MRIKEFGDFQTPLPLVRKILSTLGPVGDRWERVLEPTCGAGNFIRGILELENPPQEVIGIELQDKYVEKARRIPLREGTRVEIIARDIFGLDLGKDLIWRNKGPFLVIGNPPWVTNSTLGVLNSKNLPRKSNLKGLRGIEAITGHSNFDIAESIWLKLITELRAEDVTVALLCKTSVARNVLCYAKERGLKISTASIRNIDAKRWFGAAVDACLFTVKLDRGNQGYEADVFDSLSFESLSSRIGFVGKHLISDVPKYKEVSFIEGKSPLEWRQGVKHDAASVMELILAEKGWQNKLGEIVDVESEYLYPLIKSSDLHTSSTSPKRAVIITQKKTGDDTRHLKAVAPRLWMYLTEHRDLFQARKSSIYRGRSPFSMFGVGDYSFAFYKVIVSGLYKEPRFVDIGQIDGKPVMCDDTCYLLPFESEGQALMVASALNHHVCQQFIKSTTFMDSKRPITKKLLARINLRALIFYLWGEDSELPWCSPKKESVGNLFSIR